MPIEVAASFILIALAFASLWIKRDPLIWGPLTFASAFFGAYAGYIELMGLSLILLLTILWLCYDKYPTNFALFSIITALSMGLHMKLFPGFTVYFITPMFYIGLIKSVIGIFPLALEVPLAKSKKDWLQVLQGTAIGTGFVLLIAALALLSKSIQWDIGLPTYFEIRLFSNLFLTSIPEEALYRGFIQRTLSFHLKSVKHGHLYSVFIAAFLFSLSHILWSPNLGIQIFSFVVGILYGLIYLYTKRIEGAILTHFILNTIHMTIFTYHAE